MLRATGPIMKISLAAISQYKQIFCDTKLYMIDEKKDLHDQFIYLYIYITAVVVRSHQYAFRLKARGRLGRKKKRNVYTFNEKKLEAAACGQYYRLTNVRLGMTDI